MGQDRQQALDDARPQPESRPPHAIRSALIADRVMVLAAHLLAVVIGARNLDTASFARFLFGLAVAVAGAALVGAAADRSALAAGEIPGPGRGAAAASVLAVVVIGLSAVSLGAPPWVVAVPVAVALSVVGRLRGLAIADHRFGPLLLADLLWIGAGVAVLLVDGIGADLVSFDLETGRGYLVLWALGPCLAIVALTAMLDDVASGESWVGPTWAWFLADHLLPVGTLAIAGIGAGVVLPADEFVALAVAVALFAPVAALLAVGSNRIALPTPGAIGESPPELLTRARNVGLAGLLGSFGLVLLPGRWTAQVTDDHHPDPMLLAVVGLTVTVWAAGRALSGRRPPALLPPLVWTREAVAAIGGGVALVVLTGLTGSAFASVLPTLAVGAWLAAVQLRVVLTGADPNSVWHLPHSSTST